jgi:hypothetical protein
MGLYLNRWYIRNQVVQKPTVIESPRHLRESVLEIMQAQHDSGSKNGVWLEFTNDSYFEIHAGVSKAGCPINIKYRGSAEFSFGIMHELDPNLLASYDELSVVQFDQIGEVEKVALHPFEELLSFLWTWGETGQINVCLNTCARRK